MTVLPVEQMLTELTLESSVRLDVCVTNSVTVPRARTTSPTETFVSGLKTKIPSDVAGSASASLSCSWR